VPDERGDQGMSVKPEDVEFTAGVGRFQQFLRQNAYSDNVIWLLPDDVLPSGKRFIYVRVPIPATNEMKTRETYDEGVAAGRGLLMSTTCEMEDSTCCYVWYPRRQEDVPQGIWPHDGSMKLSAKIETSRFPGNPVKSRVLWTFLKLRHRGRQGLKDFLFS
jgi:hypothetical protein